MTIGLNSHYTCDCAYLFSMSWLLGDFHILSGIVSLTSSLRLYKVTPLSWIWRTHASLLTLSLL